MTTAAKATLQLLTGRLAQELEDAEQQHWQLQLMHLQAIEHFQAATAQIQAIAAQQLCPVMMLASHACFRNQWLLSLWPSAASAAVDSSVGAASAVLSNWADISTLLHTQAPLSRVCSCLVHVT